MEKLALIYFRKAVLTKGIFHVNDVDSALQFLASLDDSDAADVGAASDHHQLAQLEVDELGDLPAGNVHHDSVVRLDLRVVVADGTRVVSHQERNLLGRNLQLTHFAQFVLQNKKNYTVFANNISKTY